MFMGPPRGYEWAPGPGFAGRSVEGSLVASGLGQAESRASTAVERVRLGCGSKLNLEGTAGF